MLEIFACKSVIRRGIACFIFRTSSRVRKRANAGQPRFSIGTD
jgi:hypothetical protein